VNASLRFVLPGKLDVELGAVDHLHHQNAPLLDRLAIFNARDRARISEVKGRGQLASESDDLTKESVP
jgi:hypothetical protein